MVTREIKQVKWLKIYSPSDCICGHGYHDEIPGITYYDEPYISEEHTAFLSAKAQERYEKINYWVRPEKPKISIFWKEI